MLYLFLLALYTAAVSFGSIRYGRTLEAKAIAFELRLKAVVFEEYRIVLGKIRTSARDSFSRLKKHL